MHCKRQAGPPYFSRLMCCAQMPPDSQCDGDANAELSTTAAFAASTGCLLLRAVHKAASAVFVRDRDARVQQRCSLGRVLCAQLPPDSHMCRRWQLPNKRNRSFCRTRELSVLPQLVSVRPYGAYARSWCVGAASLLGGAHVLCTDAAGFAM